MTAAIPHEDQIACAERELRMRQRCYPGWVARKRMTQEAADRELAGMQAIIASLKAARAAEFGINPAEQLKPFAEVGQRLLAERWDPETRICLSTIEGTIGEGESDLFAKHFLAAAGAYIALAGKGFKP